MDRLKGKVALICNAGREYGKAIAQLFENEGAAVFVSEKSIDKVKGYKSEKIEPVRLDTTIDEECASVVNRIVETCGKLDILVICPPEYKIPFKSIIDLKLEEATKLMKLCYSTVWNCIHSSAPAMINNAAGSIVNIASAAGSISGGCAFGPAMAAAINLIQGAANELGSFNIRVNTVSPTLRADELELEDETLVQALIKKEISMTPLGKMVEPADIANAVLFLASDEAGSITALDMAVDFGLTKAGPFNS